MEGSKMSSEIRATSGDELRFIVEGGKPRIDARAILFNSWSVDLGNFRERMLPGSVQLEDDLIALFDHATDKVLGRTTAGTMQVRQDERGIAFTAFPPDTTWARDLQISMQRGDIRGCSYRMYVDEDKWYVDGEGQVCRDVIRARISELTITSMPAYPETTAEARSTAEKLRKHAPVDRAGRVLSDATTQTLQAVFSNLEVASDTLEQLLIQNDPTFNEDNYGLAETEDEGKLVDPNDASATPNAGYTSDSDILTGGSPEADDRSSDGASEPNNRQRQTFVNGFGFIPNNLRKR